MIKNFSIVTLVGVLCLVCYWQQQRIGTLKENNISLNRSLLEFQSANQTLLAQYQRINEALDNAARSKGIAEKHSHDLRKKLKQAQVGSNCANAPVPDDVIRMQREAINATNNKFTRTNGATAPMLAP